MINWLKSKSKKNKSIKDTDLSLYSFRVSAVMNIFQKLYRIKKTQNDNFIKNYHKLNK